VISYIMSASAPTPDNHLFVLTSRDIKETAFIAAANTEWIAHLRNNAYNTGTFVNELAVSRTKNAMTKSFRDADLFSRLPLRMVLLSLESR